MLIKNSEDLTERKFPQLVILTRLSVSGKRTSRTNPLPATYAARLSPTSTTSVTTSPFTRQSNRTVARCAAAALLPPPPSDTTGLLSRDTHIWELCIFYFCECASDSDFCLDWVSPSYDDFTISTRMFLNVRRFWR